MQLSLKRLLNETSLSEQENPLILEPPTFNHSFYQPESNHSNNSPRKRKKQKLEVSPRTRDLLSLDFILNATNVGEGGDMELRNESSEAIYKQQKKVPTLRARYFTSRITNYEFVTVCFTPKGKPWSYHPKGGGGLQLAMVRRHLEEFSSVAPD